MPRKTLTLTPRWGVCFCFVVFVFFDINVLLALRRAVGEQENFYLFNAH